VVQSRWGFAKVFLLVFTEGASLSFLVGLYALSPNQSLKRRFRVDVLTSAPVNKQIWSNLFAQRGGWAQYHLLYHVIISLTGNLGPTSPAVCRSSFYINLFLMILGDNKTTTIGVRRKPEKLLLCRRVWGQCSCLRSSA